MNKNLNNVPSAGTEAEQRTADDVCSSPPAIANTHVVGSQSHPTKSDAPIFKELHPFDAVSLVKAEPLSVDNLLLMEFDVNGEKQSVCLSSHQLLSAIKKHLAGVTTRDCLRQSQK